MYVDCITFQLYETTLGFAILELFFISCSVVPYQICQQAPVPGLLVLHPFPSFPESGVQTSPLPVTAPPASAGFQRLYSRPHSAASEQT